MDQSTQGTKALLFDAAGKLLLRRDKPHRQIVSPEGWVSHDPEELYQNSVEVLRNVVMDSGVDGSEIAGLGISNQRETSIGWERKTGKAVAHGIVWQCSRAGAVCKSLQKEEEFIREVTGINLSPYFPASKFAWLIRNCPGVKDLMEEKNLCLGTVDSYLVYRLTGGMVFKTDYSNASRTQLFNLQTGLFDDRLCSMFGIARECLPEIEDSDGSYGMTDLDGFLAEPIPICAVLGDSHAALFGQHCLEKGMTKATFGTGSSIMMNVGEQPVYSKHGLVSSVGFKINNKMSYVLEGNLNYTGAVISWLKDNLELIDTDAETERLAVEANPADHSYLVPAFTGLGAPYWDSTAHAAIIGMSRTTGRAELVKAALSCIAYQITDVVKAMEKDGGLLLGELKVDGGPTRNRFLMQLQSDLLNTAVMVPEQEELSGIGAAYAAGMAAGVYDETVFRTIQRTAYYPAMEESQRHMMYSGWKDAVSRVIGKESKL